MKKILAYGSMFLMMVMAAVSVSAAGTDFSGTWKLDASKSTLPQGPGGGGGGGEITLDVKQDAKTLTAVRKTARGEQITTYNLDGSETTSKMTGRMEGTSTHKAKWQGDGKILEINTVSKLSMQGQEFEITAQAHWELADGGKTLKIHTKRTTPRGEQESTEVYAKQ
ncbi:MAG: hypothetical protein AB1757_08065 [Acidobacteriota bacterium]